MPFYPDDLVNEIFSENDIVDYISQYVRLKKTGKDYSGLCPFHKEKSPSFHVSREKQLFHCFGCGASGNLVQFVMRNEGLDFVEALKLLAERAGIDLPEGNNYASDESYILRKKILEMNKISARFFYNTLTKTPQGKTGLIYLAERKITKKTIITYGLGFAQDSYTALHDYLLKSGYTNDDMLKAGLCIERDGKIYDKFRNRVIFPIIDLRGNIIGFGGRMMGQNSPDSNFKIPKYLNSSETPVFNKGKNLFSLNLAKKSSPYSIILVEGYMDVITVFQAGIPNVVATLGTAMTENQAKLLMKYCSEILICYDSDEAGQKATIRAIEIINSIGGRSRVIKLKGSKDPDEYIKANGVAMFSKAVSSAVASTQFRLDILKKKYSLDSPEGKSLFIAEATDVLKSIQDAVEVDAYINKISSETEISKDAIYSELRKKIVNNSKLQTKHENKEIKNETKIQNVTVFNNQSQKLINAEKKLINLIIDNKKYIDIVMSEFKPEEFQNEIHQKIIAMIYQARKEDKLLEPSIIMNAFSKDEITYVSEIFYNFEEFNDNAATLDELINTIKLEKLTYRISHEKDPAVINSLVTEMSELRRNK